jgi:phosphoglycerate dehydrogenase-like enzyme
MRLAIIDDYQSVSGRFADWNGLSGVTVVPFRDHVFDADELVARLSDFDAILRLRERTEFPRSVLERLPRLKLMLCTGMRNARSLDLEATDELGITVCATEVQHTSTIEIAWLLILGLFRRFPQERASLSAGGWQIGLGTGLNGSTLGVLGLGHLGQPVAKIAQGFGMRVIAWSPNLTPARTAPFNVECVSKQDLFRRADAITIHMPLSSKSLGLVGEPELSLMKPSAFLVNTSRAEIVQREPLLTALREQRIGGAGLDVFDVEPSPMSDPFRTLPNVIATPHIGFVTSQNYELFYGQSFENLKAYLAGKPIRVVTNKQPFLSTSALGGEKYVA